MWSVQILETKIRKLEQLVKLKDTKIQTKATYKGHSYTHVSADPATMGRQANLASLVGRVRLQRTLGRPCASNAKLVGAAHVPIPRLATAARLESQHAISARRVPMEPIKTSAVEKRASPAQRVSPAVLATAVTDEQLP